MRHPPSRPLQRQQLRPRAAPSDRGVRALRCRCGDCDESEEPRWWHSLAGLSCSKVAKMGDRRVLVMVYVVLCGLALWVACGSSHATPAFEMV